MGLATELGYHHKDRGLFHRGVTRIFENAAMSSLAANLMPPLDRFTHRLTGGSSTISDWLAGLPPLWVTTTGARSGKPRRVPLYGIPINTDLALMGTSYGREATPGWVYNLEANPEATVTFKEWSLPALARHATDAEEPHIWNSAASLYGGYPKYAERASHRRIRVFVLEAAG
jgi:deazaflavin-dependent oxidoreductase (nitroreductase family)